MCPQSHTKMIQTQVYYESKVCAPSMRDYTDSYPGRINRTIYRESEMGWALN